MIILMEFDYLLLGYIRLEFIIFDILIFNEALCFLYVENGKLFVLSRKYYYNSLYGIQFVMCEFSLFNEYGFCWNFVLDEMEVDFIYCFKLDYWLDKV